jgi:hypothetical protein
MKRREFIVGLGGVAVWPAPTRAIQSWSGVRASSTCVGHQLG